VEGTTEGDVDVVVSVGMVAQEDLVEIILKATREKKGMKEKKKRTKSMNNHSVGREAEVAVDSVVVDAIDFIVAEEGGGDHALTPKVKIQEREKVSKRSNGKVVVTASVSVVVAEGDPVQAVVADEVVGGDSLVDSTVEGLQGDVLKVTVKEEMSKRGARAVKIASPSPMRALHKQHL